MDISYVISDLNGEKLFERFIKTIKSNQEKWW